MIKVKELFSNISTRTKSIAVGTSAIVMTIASAVPAHAADTLDPAITAGFTSAAATTALVIGAGVAACVGVIALSGGAKAGLKWIKGVFAKAS